MKQFVRKILFFAITMVVANFILANRSIGQGTGVVTITSATSCLQFDPGGGGGSPDNYRVAPGGTYTMTITNVTECSGNYITVFVQNSGSSNFCFTLYNGGSGNTYSGPFTVPIRNCLTSPVSYKCGENAPCNNSNTFNARSINGKNVHLDAYAWGPNCTALGQVACGACVPTAPEFDNCTGGTTDLGCNPTPPVCRTDVTAHNNCGETVTVTCEPGQVIEDGCNRSQKFTYTATASGLSSTCERTFTWREDHTGPVVTNDPPASIQALCTTTFNNLPWQAPQWSDGCGGQVTVTDEISPNQQQTSCPATYTRTWTAKDVCQNPSTFTQTITVPCCTVCTYTQGAWGSTGGASCNGTVNQISTSQLIINSLGSWGGTMTVGMGTKTVFISNATAGYVNCVLAKLPGGGPAKELPAGNTNICNLPSGLLKNGKINNVFLSQTITLGLNMGIMTSPNLSNFVLQGGVLAVAQVQGGCGGNGPVQRECTWNAETQTMTVKNDYKYYTIDPVVVNALGPIPANRTVGALFNLANKALANYDGIEGKENGVPITSISNLVDIINNAFDGCRVPVGYNIPACTPPGLTEKGGNGNVTYSNATSSVQKGDDVIGPKINVAAYPNPFTDRVRFVINSPAQGIGTLEIYTMTGQKVQVIPAGYIQAGVERTVEYNVPAANRTNQLYIFKVGDKSVSGKLISVNTN